VNVVAFLVSGVLFVGSFLLFGYAFSFPGLVGTLMFVGGILAVAISLMLPFHVYGESEQP